MKKAILEELYRNRLLNTKEESEKFVNSINEMSEVVEEEDIVELCKVFDDDTKDDEIMFELVHLIEVFSSEKAFELTILGIANMVSTAQKWAKILVYRCLNDDFSRNMLKKAINLAEFQVQQVIISLLDIIKIEDFDKFGIYINEVLD